MIGIWLGMALALADDLDARRREQRHAVFSEVAGTSPPREPSQRATLRLRLAALSMEEAEDLREQGDDASAAWYRRAAVLCAAIQADLPDYARIDEVRLVKAEALLGLGAVERAHLILVDLAESQPPSPRRAEAALRLGALYVSLGNTAEAQRAFQRAAADPASAVYPQARRELARAHRRLGAYPEAIAEMEALAVWLAAEQPSSALLREAPGELVALYAAADTLAEGARWLGAFTTAALPPDVLRALIVVFDEQGWIEHGIAARQALLAAAPRAADAPVYHLAIVQALWESGAEDAAQAAATQMARRCGPRSRWAWANRRDAPARAQARAMIAAAALSPRGSGLTGSRGAAPRRAGRR